MGAIGAIAGGVIQKAVGSLAGGAAGGSGGEGGPKDILKMLAQLINGAKGTAGGN